MSSFIYVGQYGYFLFPDEVPEKKVIAIFNALAQYSGKLSYGELLNEFDKPIYVPFEKELPEDVVKGVIQLYSS